MCYHFWQEVAPSPSWQDISWSNFFCFSLSATKLLDLKLKFFISSTYHKHLCIHYARVCCAYVLWMIPQTLFWSWIVGNLGSAWGCCLEPRFLCFFWNPKGSTLNKRYTMVMFFQLYPLHLSEWESAFALLYLLQCDVGLCCTHQTTASHTDFPPCKKYSIRLSCVSLTFYNFLAVINLSAQFDINP